MHTHVSFSLSLYIYMYMYIYIYIYIHTQAGVLREGQAHGAGAHRDKLHRALFRTLRPAAGLQTE